MRRAIIRSALLLPALPLVAWAARAEPPRITLGTLRFGTAAREAETIRHPGLDSAHGFALVAMDFASNARILRDTPARGPRDAPSEPPRELVW